jgi:hypothetical protein
VDAVTLHVLRTESAAGTADRGKWNVLTDAGELVGLIFEERPWLGSQYGPVTYTAVRNPTGRAFAAVWRSEGHPTVPAAVAALEEHLLEEHSSDRPQRSG